MKQEKIKNILLVVLVLALLLIAGTYTKNYVETKAFDAGVIQATQNIAIQQTQTGNILYVNNNTVQTITVAQICGVAE